MFETSYICLFYNKLSERAEYVSLTILFRYKIYNIAVLF